MDAITTTLLQTPTKPQNGTDAVVNGWISAIGEFLAENNLAWAQVQGVGLAIPGPYQRYGVLDRSANLPPSFIGFDLHTAFSSPLAKRAGRAVRLVVGNDGNFAAVPEARRVRGGGTAPVLMLAPGS